MPTAALRLRTLNFRLRLYLVSGLLCGPDPQMASPTSKPPSKPVQPLKVDWYADVGVSSVNIILCYLLRSVKKFR